MNEETAGKATVSIGREAGGLCRDTEKMKRAVAQPDYGKAAGI